MPVQVENLREMMGFDAEEARRTGTVVDLDEFRLRFYATSR